VKQLVQLTVNGDERAEYVDTRRTLLELVREEFSLFGTHRGCDSGHCGACTVLLDGQPVNSCLVLAADCEGAHVLTIEGLAQSERLHPVQHQLVEQGGIQCGFCTPGMVMSAVALLEETPHPDESQVRQALAGNLCRCTGYAKIVAAVLAAADEIATQVPAEWPA
jgi:carbon-monoxide dehydrogenase small subunit